MGDGVGGEVGDVVEGVAAEVADGGDECAVGEDLVAAERTVGGKGSVGGSRAEVDVKPVPAVLKPGEAVGGEAAVEIDREPGPIVKRGRGEGRVVAGVEEPVVVEGSLIAEGGGVEDWDGGGRRLRAAECG